MQVQRLVLMVGAVFLGGCSTLSSQLKMHSENVARCDKLLAEPDLPDWKIDQNYLLERAGFIGQPCKLQKLSFNDVRESNWQAICELEEIVSQDRTPAIDQELQRITTGYKHIKTGIDQLREQCIPKTLKSDASPPSLTIRQLSSCLQAAIVQNEKSTDLPSISKSATQIIKATESLTRETTGNEQKDLQLWAATVKSSLQKLQSPATYARDAIANLPQSHAVTHLAQQSYRRLKKTVALGDKSINRVDDKTNGALSIGNMFFGETLSEELAKTVSPTLLEFQKQHPEDPLASVGMFTRAVARSACENQNNGEDTGLLQNLLDSTLIRLADPATKESGAAKSPTQIQHLHPDYIVPSYAQLDIPARRRPTVADFSPTLDNSNSTKKTAETNPAPQATSATSTAANTAEAAQTIHAIYAGYEWQARRHLLQQQQDKLTSYAGTLPLPSEARVQELAKAAAAMEIAPEFLEQLAQTGKASNYALPEQNIRPDNLSRSARDNEQITASQTTNRTPDIHIHYTPPPKPALLPDLCSTLRDGNILCQLVNDRYLLQPISGFESAAYIDQKLDKALNRIGGIIQSYTQQHPAGYRATVTGYASHKEAAQLCWATHQTWPKKSDYVIDLEYSPISYKSGKSIQRISTAHRVNGMSFSFDVDCRGTEAKEQGNRLLSAARAIWVAHQLEQYSGGAIHISDIKAAGDSKATLNPTDAAADRTVVIILVAK